MAGTNPAAANLAGFWQEGAQTGSVGFSDNVNQTLQMLTSDLPTNYFFFRWGRRSARGYKGRELN